MRNKLKILFAFSLLVLINFSGCSVIGLSIGIATQDYEKFRPLYDIDSLKLIEPGTEVKIELINDESVKGTFLYIEEFYKAGYFSGNGSDSVYQKGYWEILLNVSNKEELFNSNEVKMVEEFYEEGNYAVPIGLGIGIAVDVLFYFWIKSLDFRT